MSDALAAGDRIGRYVIEAPLGHGGMGEVYRAYDDVLHRQVALKLLRAAPDGTPGALSLNDGGVARIVREARMAAALAHPNVVAVHDVGEHAGGAFIVMEYVAGTSLAAFVARADEVPLAQRLVWLTEVARALDAAHRVGLVHRDIKPENVMVRADGTAKVLDFGIARPPRERRSAPPVPPPAEPATSATRGGVGRAGDFTVGATAEDGVLVGTPGYIAPEQIRHGVFDARSDQFAWGVLAYELLAGGLPWRVPETDATALVTATLFDEPEPLGVRRPELPEPLVAVVHRALAKDPSARFASMEALLAVWGAVAGLLSPGALHASIVPSSVVSLRPGGASAPSLDGAPTTVTFAVAPTIQAPSVEIRAPPHGRRGTRPSERTPSPTTLPATTSADAPTASLPRTLRRRRAALSAAAAVVVLGGAATATWRSVVARRADDAARAAAAAPPFVFAPGRPSRVTYDEGCEENPVVLPDNRRVVFDAASGQDYHLNEVDVFTNVRRELTRGEGWDFAPAVSPDGRLLAYRHSGGNGGVYLRAYDDLDAPPRRISGGTVRPAFSRDGRALWVGDDAGALTRIDLGTGAVQRTLLPPPGTFVVLVVELPDGRVAVRLSERDSHSPRGTGVFPAGGGAMRWLFDAPTAVALAVSPGGHDLIVARLVRPTVSEPWRVPLDGSPPTPIAGTDVLPIEGMAFAPDGRSVVWSTCASRPDIAGLVPDAAHPGSLRAAPLFGVREWEDALATGVHGTDLIVVSSDRGGGLPRPWVMDRAGHAPARMLPSRGDAAPTGLSASRDGRLVAVATPHDGIYVTALEGAATPRVLTRGVFDRCPAFAPDGRRVYYEARRDDGQPQVMVVALEPGATPEPALPPGSACPTVAPDGRTLAYIERSDGDGGVPWLHDLTTGQRRLLSAALPVARYEAVQFSHDGTRAAACDRVNTVFELDVATGAVTGRYDGGGDQTAGIAYTASGLIVTRHVWSGDLLRAEGTFR